MPIYGVLFDAPTGERLMFSQAVNEQSAWRNVQATYANNRHCVDADLVTCREVPGFDAQWPPDVAVLTWRKHPELIEELVAAWDQQEDALAMERRRMRKTT